MLVGAFVVPVARLMVTGLYQEQYAELVFKCDQAMREHYLAKARSAGDPNADNVNLQIQAEVALVDCHEYDLMRKHLLRLGLSENDLALIGLNAIERLATDVRQIVRIHEIRD